MCIDHILLPIHLSNGPLDCFHLSAIVNNAVMNVGAHITFWDSAFNSFGYRSRSRVAGLYGNYIFNFLRNHQTVFHSGCTILHSHQQCTSVLTSPHPRQHLLFSGFFFFFLVAIWMGLREYLTPVVVCISLMISVVEHIFICLLAELAIYLQAELFTFTFFSLFIWTSFSFVPLNWNSSFFFFFFF